VVEWGKVACLGALGVEEHGGVLGAAVGVTGGELLLTGALLCSGVWMMSGPFLSGVRTWAGQASQATRVVSSVARACCA
jgi:hypothetical protein